MYFELLKLRRLGFHRRNTANQASNPIGSLKGLIPMTFSLKRRLYYSIPWRARIKHDSRRLINQLRPLLMLIHNDQNVSMFSDWTGAVC